MTIDPAVDAVRRHAGVLQAAGSAGGILEAIDPAASLVLIGEATHGTHEFYRIRADVTRALIERRGFSLVAVEADWRMRIAQIDGRGSWVTTRRPKTRARRAWRRRASSISDSLCGRSTETRPASWA